MTIYFYSRADEHGYLSNFASYGFELDGKYWRTSEHYFQAQKFITTAPKYAEKIRIVHTPKEAANMGRSRKYPLRANWDNIKDEVMYRAVLKKFQTHADIRQRLLATGDEPLVENAPGDYYWGSGADGSGQNKLGKLLMVVRDRLRQDESNPN